MRKEVCLWAVERVHLKRPKSLQKRPRKGKNRVSIE